MGLRGRFAWQMPNSAAQCDAFRSALVAPPPARLNRNVRRYQTRTSVNDAK
jgi:hypothetical protein